MRPLTIWNAYLAAEQDLHEYEAWLTTAQLARRKPAEAELRARQERFERRLRFRRRCELRLAVALGGFREVGGFAPGGLSRVELAAIRERAEHATPGPWHVRLLDDTHAMGLVAVSTVPDTGWGERWPEFDHGEIVAATLIQAPRYVDVADQRWDENAAFIAHAREDVPRLLAEVERLRALVERAGPAPPPVPEP